jgi:hypothetical protein
MPTRGKGARGTSEGKGDESAGKEALDGLYQIPLTEFTPARNALVTRLKKAGRPDEAEQIKALVKPSVPAWTVNQLFWRHRPAFDALLAIGERFRKAQAAQFHGQPSDLRGPLEERREALSSLARQAAALLRDGGYNPTPEAMRRITSTLEALSIIASADGASPDAPRAGRLIDDVDPPGFETLAALVPRVDDEHDPAAGPSRVLAFRQQKPARAATPRQHDSPDAGTRAEAARAAVQAAERAVGAARRAAEKAEHALKRVARRAKDAERARRDAERNLEKAAADSEAARQQARKTAAAAEEAAQAVDDAERALAAARQKVNNAP